MASKFNADFADNMKDPDFAYDYGRQQRELEIIDLLEVESKTWQQQHALLLDYLVAAIKEQNK